MALEISGINRLLKELNNLQNIDIKDDVVEVANDMRDSIRKKASEFSKKGYKCIATCEPRCYKNTNCFVDIGLKNDKAPWEEWKELYFHNFGYADKGLGNRFKGMMITTHILWFDDAVNIAAKSSQEKLKKKVKEKVHKALEG